MQRLNFLYQASVYLNAVSSSVGHPSTLQEQGPTASTSTSIPIQDPLDHPDNRASQTHASTADLSRGYVGAMKAISQKTVVKMDPAIKRTLCKGCSTILIPGCTATVRTKPSLSHGHAITYSCIKCKTSRRIPAPPVLHLGSYDNHSASFRPGLSKVVDNEMHDDHDAQRATHRPRAKQRKRKKRPVPRRQPLFQQPGHIVFCGNERVAEGDE